MCGIAGILARDRSAAVNVIPVMMDAQAHRGPDDEGCITLAVREGVLVLGHRRLAIQDLSSAGHQPMENPETGDWIVFNGEIYNYLPLRAQLEAVGKCFRSRCDTEVILHGFAHWGMDVFDRLHGMFAIGLFARSLQQFVLARDPLGIKPLYYAWYKNGFVFASELRAIMASRLVENTVDRGALASLMAYGAVPGPLTMMKNVELMEPGSWATLDLSAATFEKRQLKCVRYWDFPEPGKRSEASGKIAEEIGALLVSSVRSHLISDVPTGVFLSSGLDSSALATLCSEVHPGDVDTFTISFVDEPHLDENPIAERTAHVLGTRHHKICMTELEVRSLADSWLGSLDQPSVDGLNTFIISHAVRQRGIKVALSGLGGDELFGGYSTFRDVPRLLHLAWVGRWLPAKVRRRIAGWLLPKSTATQRQKAVELAGGSLSLPSIYFRRRRLLSDLELATLGFRAGELDFDENFLPGSNDVTRGLFSSDPLRSISILETRNYMGNMLLRDSDVFSMAHGLEIRVPFLDRPLIDVLFSLPDRIRIPTRRSNKPLLTAALAGRLPVETLSLAKRGFSLPHSRWMTGPLRDRFESLIDTTRQCGLVDPDGVSMVWERFLREPAGGPAWSRAWIMAVVGAWLTHRAHVPRGSLPCVIG